MNHLAHNTTQQNHAVSWSFSHSDCNGKEKDYESGFHYYGARYYWDELLTGWLSVDPMMDKSPSISSYAYCIWNPVKLVDPDGNDWYEIENKKTNEKEIKWTDCHSQDEMNNKKMSGRYLGEVFVDFKGSDDEKLGSDNTMTGNGAIPATVTIYGKNGKNDIDTYNGMTKPYSDNFSTLNEGEYKAFYQDMSSSVYGEQGAKKKGIPPALTYRITQLDGSTILRGKRNEQSIDMEGVFMHRTNWDGNAAHSSMGCLIIDGREWRRVEKQIGKSSNIFIRLTR